MAWTQSDLDAIEKAIATGARRVRYQTHEVEYQSLSDMLKVRQIIKDELAGNSPGVVLTEYQSGA
ncbi:hypothetical protein NKH71_03220 [Mesorhizobium sp. M0983]|uniref:phage head-tail joining protein n=1 Tax=Mesorhizobium sp. M0983 TaxID=2957040 RepID=UPI003334CB6A